MIVIDASALAELLTNANGAALRVRDVLAADTEWIGPEHLLVETASALRGLWLGGITTDAEFTNQLDTLGSLRIASIPFRLLLPRVRELAANATSYDAAYLAAAEHLRCRLVTLDSKLARVPGSPADVHLIERR
ncbi:MAG: type II toxin-antitoxin system VapC family toxin [Rhodococcus sp.]|nr:type II toxin-antitoxin system VapC family toxin [Rhodococcus sp. (in: high G+C Gram-positive bacteria)]